AVPQGVAMPLDFTRFPARLPRVTRAQVIDDGPDRADELDVGRVDLIRIRRRVDVEDGAVDLPRLDQLDRIEADRRNEIARFQEPPDDLIARHVERAGEVRMVLGKNALRLRRDNDRTTDALREG